MKALIATSVLGLFAMISEIIGLKKWIWYISIAGLAGIIGLSISEYGNNGVFYGMISFDNYSSIFGLLLLTIAFLWFILAKPHYSEAENANASDQAALILFATVGGLILSSFSNLTMFFLGIEILSIPMYILAGSDKRNLASNESSLKYFIMGSFATGILLFGVALLYGATGSFDIMEINMILSEGRNNPSIFFLAVTGIIMIMIGLCFKISAVPFHFWTPDVYEGAPTMVTAFMSTFVKTAAFVAFFRLFAYYIPNVYAWQYQLIFIAALTILVGNITAVRQSSFKRTLAYSGIAQAGYIMLTLLIGPELTVSALFIYIASYSLSTLLGFTVLYHVQKSSTEAGFEIFKGLGKSNPGLAVVLSLAMLSLAGIPPTVGFFAKFYLFKTIFALHSIAGVYIVLFAILGSLISLYYYFKVIISMFGTTENPVKVEFALSDRILLYLTASLILVLGLVPNLLLQVSALLN